MQYRPSSPTSCKTWACMFDYQIMLLSHTICAVFVAKLWGAELAGFLWLLLARRQTWMCVYMCLSGHRQSREGHRNCRGSGPLPQNTGKCVTAVSVALQSNWNNTFYMQEQTVHVTQYYFLGDECQQSLLFTALIKSCCPHGFAFVWHAMLESIMNPFICRRCLLRQASLLVLLICDLNKLPTISIRHLLHCLGYRQEWYLKLLIEHAVNFLTDHAYNICLADGNGVKKSHRLALKERPEPYQEKRIS